MTLKKWKVLASKIVFESPWIRVRQDEVELPDGSVRKDYFVRETKRVVYVFALTEDNKVILNNQYKHGAGAIMKELPAGMVEKNETPLAAIKRELFEETGYAAGKIKLIDHFYGDPSGSNTKIWCYLATGCHKVGQPQNNPSEIIELELVTVTQLKQLVKQGKINGQGALAAILHGLAAIGEL
ncbi:MAG: NUDIX hydrolase [Patescibacteria group bacterium]